MPCLILCGHPCAGKTRLAHCIRDRVLQHNNNNNNNNSNTIRQVIIINEATACPDQGIGACYATAEAEKRTRGALKAAFDRSVNEQDDGTLVILDSSNYIKGFRYELHCISKAAGQKHGVVWVLNESRICKEWNQTRRRQQQEESDKSDAEKCNFYSDALMEELIMRFEPPDARNRWDNPLYRIDVRPEGVKHQSGLAMEALTQSVYNMHKLSDAIIDDKDSGTAATTPSSVATQKKTTSTFKRAGFKKKTAHLEQSESTDRDTTTQNPQKDVDKKDTDPTAESKLRTVEEQIDEMLDSFLQNVQPLKQGVSTQHNVSSDANVLHDVDSITQKVCSLIATAQNKSTTAGGRLAISLGANTTDPLWFNFNRRIGLPELKRLRRQYIQWVVAHPPEDATERGIAQAFIAYIAAQ